MVKKISLILISLLTVLSILLFCSSPDSPQKKDPSLTIVDFTSDSLTVVASGVTKTFKVDANIEWTVSGSTDWLSIANNGKDSFTVVATPNSNSNPRTTQIIITSKDPAITLSKAININQEGAIVIPSVKDTVPSKDTLLHVDPPQKDTVQTKDTVPPVKDTVVVPKDTVKVVPKDSLKIIDPVDTFTCVNTITTKTVKVKATIAWKASVASSGADWISIGTTTKDSFVVKVNANTTQAIRQAIVIVSGGVLSDTLKVSQAAAAVPVAPVLSLTGGNKTIVSDGATVTAFVQSTIEWVIVKSDTAWLTVSKNAKGDSVIIKAAKNTSAAVRTGKVTLASKDAALNLTSSITITQSASSATPPISSMRGRAFQITAEMGVGWNLGNTMDAGGSSETNWGNPKTTKAMIDAVKKQGFNTLRIPITWDSHISNNTIASSWLDRVEEIVNYGLSNNMYVIINTHHDGQSHNTTKANESSVTNYMTNVWKQVSARFSKYDYHVIFEVMNEPRKDPDWWGVQEYFDVVNNVNAATLQVIRNSGGNNATRLVMLPGYCASANDFHINALKIPSDTMIAVSTHAYFPFTFCMEQSSGSDKMSSTAEIDDVFKRLGNKFIKNGVPVVMGEWGASNKNNLSERVRHAEYYSKAAKAAKIPSVVWDNNFTTAWGSDAMGMLNRNNCTWYFPDIVNAIVKGAQ